MAESTAFDGYGIIFGIGDGTSSESFVDVAEIIDVSGPGFSRDTIDVSHSGSPNHYREFIAGFKDGGEVTLTMNMTQADYTSFLAKFDSDAANNFKITIPDSNFTTLPTILFSGIVTGVETEYSIEDKVTANVTIKVTGKPVHTQGT